MSSRSMTYEECRKANIEPFESCGPSTARLNRFAQQAGYDFAYDLNAIQTEQYYIKRTHQQWRKSHWRKDPDNSDRREFEDEDVNLAYQSLCQFQEICDQHQISTRSAVAFYQDVSEVVKNRSADYDNLPLFQVLSLALADSAFLFDSAVVKYQPSFFLTRASITELKDFSGVSIRKDNKRIPIPKEAIDHMRNILQEQVREMHLMLPYHMLYSSALEEKVLPTIERLQSRAKAYGSKASVPDEVPSDWKNKEQIIRTVAQSYLWFLRCQRQLNWEKNQENESSEKTFAAMLDKDFESSKLYQCVSKLVNDAEKSPWATFAPLYFYRVMTAYCSRILEFRAPEPSTVMNLDVEIPGKGFKSTAQTAQKHYRCNLLLFKKLCHDLASYFPSYVIERAIYLFEVSEDISRVGYPSDRLLGAEPDSREIKAYITNGTGEGSLVFPELFCLTERMKTSLAISPFDLLSVLPWTVTTQELGEFLYSAKAIEKEDNEKKHRGKRLPKYKVIQKALKAYDSTLEFGEYYQIVFKDACGYGSGLPSYAWVFRLAKEIDKILKNSDELKRLFDISPKYAELVELGIHACLLENFVTKAEKTALALAKEFFYSRCIIEC